LGNDQKAGKEHANYNTKGKKEVNKLEKPTKEEKKKGSGADQRRKIISGEQASVCKP